MGAASRTFRSCETPTPPPFWLAYALALVVAVQVAIARNMLRCLIYREPSLAEAISALNTILARHNLLTGFITLFVGLYHAGTRRLTYVSCGHEPGLLRRAGTWRNWGRRGRFWARWKG